MEKDLLTDPSGFETLEAFSGADAFNQWLFNKLNRFVQGEPLEIGSGTGNISAFLLKNHDKISLSDLRPEYCLFLRNKFSHDPHLKAVYQLDLSAADFNLKYPELLKKFDTVIASNVIEHIKDDSLAIRNAKALLKNNGRMVILVPSGQWLFNSIDVELGHFKRYSKSSLNKLLESAGLIVIKSMYFNAAAIAGWWFSGNILREKILSPAKLKLYNRLVPLFRIVDWFVAPFTGISVISVGVKNEN